MSASFGQSGAHTHDLPFVVTDGDGKQAFKIADDDLNPGVRTLQLRGTSPIPYDPFPGGEPNPEPDPNANFPALEYEMQSLDGGGGQTYTIYRRDGTTSMIYQVDGSHLMFESSSGAVFFDLDPNALTLRLSNASGGEMLSFVGSIDPELDIGDVRFGPGTTLTLSNYVDMPVRVDDPDPPPADTIRLYAKAVEDQTIFFARFGPDGDPVQIVAS